MSPRVLNKRTDEIPKRIQLRRTKGWRIPPNTVVVSRPSKWGNPFKVGVYGTRRACFLRYSVWVQHHPKLSAELHELRGHNLGCWCRPSDPCHADVLLELANE